MNSVSTVGAARPTARSPNTRAIGLYEKLGFVVEGRYRRHWRRRDGSLWDSLLMGLVLDETSPGGPGPPR